MSFKIVIASGKGGTGKTLLSVNLAIFFKEYIKEKVALIDLDVEEPNSAIFLKGSVSETKVVTRDVPSFNKNLCTNCNACNDVCMFNALIKTKERVLIYKNLCHSCNACVKICPERALTMKQSRIGEVHIMETKFKIPFIEGILDLKEEMSTSLIVRTKKIAEEKFSNYDLHIYDSPPGTSCSYMESIKDANIVIIITEPTPFGMSDSAIAIEVAKNLRKKIAVVINKGSDDDREVVQFFNDLNVNVIAQIRNNRKIAEVYSIGERVLGVNSNFDNAIEKIADYIIKERKL